MSNFDPKNIIFLREYSGDYFAFKDCNFIKILEIEHIKTELPMDCHWIFTSKNSVLAVGENLGNNYRTHHNNIYCLGQKSNSIAAEIFPNHQVHGKDACTSDELANLIVSHERDREISCNQRSSYAFFSGDKSLQTLPAILQENGISCRQIQVYKTKVLSIDAALLQDKMVVLFSPSGLKSLGNILDINCCWIAIGKTTGQALQDSGAKRIFVSKTPTPEGVMEAILQYLKTVNT